MASCRGRVHAAQVGDGHRNRRRLSRGQVHLGPSVATVTPGVARLPAQNQNINRPAGTRWTTSMGNSLTGLTSA